MFYIGLVLGIPRQLIDLQLTNILLLITPYISILDFGCWVVVFFMYFCISNEFLSILPPPGFLFEGFTFLPSVLLYLSYLRSVPWYWSKHICFFTLASFNLPNLFRHSSLPFYKMLLQIWIPEVLRCESDWHVLVFFFYCILYFYHLDSSIKTKIKNPNILQCYSYIHHMGMSVSFSVMLLLKKKINLFKYTGCTENKIISIYWILIT